MAGETTARKPNRLIHETSPYLLQHAYNPVDWYPWGEEAFARARKENKPIFLSIGYSTCHWCHVMEHESFENDDIAAVMNRYFVCIKVDREERPDIDHIYMAAVQATTGSGGWPMSVWLTPDLKPFFCGTYFPPDARYGRPGFKELLERVHDVWETNHDAVVAQAGQIAEAVGRYATMGREGSGERALDDAALPLAFEQFRSSYDEVNGGFGGAPKFPRPVALNLLFRYFARTNDVAARDMAVHTLRAMGEGGMFDQLGGGFHRYSVDDHWLVSHFEKMLYDQAQLVSSYVDAYQITRDPFYADIARRTCDYVLRDMTSPEGGFYSAEDADSEGVEGKFYVWTRQEIEKALGKQADAFCRAYGVTADGNWEGGSNVLHVASPDAAKFTNERAKLFAIREKRVRPHRDEKILTAWNGLMISALARAAQALDDPEYREAADPAFAKGFGGLAAGHSNAYLEAARRAARYLVANRLKDGRLTRTATVPAMVEDYAFLGNGLVDLYETDFDPQWLVTATKLADTMLAQFYDAKAGGFFQTDGHDASVIVRAKEDYDGAEPSGNSMAAMLLLRLAQFADRANYRDAAEKTLQLFGDHLRKAPSTVPQMACALDFYLSKPKQIVIAGKPGTADAEAMLRAVRERYLPNAIVILADGAESQKMLTKLLPFLESIKPIDGKATAYVCVNYACQLPTSDVRKFGEMLGGK
ncbi:MAG TPA: thioredoxin domain-containing protein [Verrucomicrobiae bacterium]|nr:thioredoxin domain-containing protein [Verrucomicrobiae bacterium]